MFLKIQEIEIKHVWPHGGFCLRVCDQSEAVIWDLAYLSRCCQSPGQHPSPAFSWPSLCFPGQNSLSPQTQASTGEVPHCTFLFRHTALGVRFSMGAIFQDHRPGPILWIYSWVSYLRIWFRHQGKRRDVRSFSRSSLSQVKTRQTPQQS